MATSVEVPRKRFTIEQYHRMGTAGVFGIDERQELLNGEIVTMSPIGRRHASRTRFLIRQFSKSFAQRAIIDVQNPVILSQYSEPQPDVVLLKWREDCYENIHPEAQDVLLIVEIGDTSAELDRLVKMPLYAEAGIEELWLVNLQTDEIEACRQAKGADYQSIVRYTRDQRLNCQAFPDVTFAVDEILGPR